MQRGELASPRGRGGREGTERVGMRGAGAEQSRDEQRPTEETEQDRREGLRGKENSDENRRERRTEAGGTFSKQKIKV